MKFSLPLVRPRCLHLLTLVALTAPLASLAQMVISDTLTGVASPNNWTALKGACLTAATPQTNSGTIPGCVGLGYYAGKTLVGGVNGSLPDPVGQGALRLTNGDTSSTGSNGTKQSGAVISTTPFPTNLGVQVTFSTATYGGNALNGTGADGIAFFLVDASYAPFTATGAYGGSMGYSCSQNSNNNPYDGMVGGYIAVGIDEFGNFSNGGSGTGTDNTASGPGARPGYVGVRGAGVVNWKQLNALYPTNYPSTLSTSDQQAAIASTCQSGYQWNYGSSVTTCKTKNGNTTCTINETQTTTPVLDYPYLGGQAVNVAIANQEAVNNPTRGAANALTWALKITQAGLLSLSYSANGGAAIPVLNGLSITAKNGPLPSNFLFGFSAGTGGGSNVHEITCFKATQIDVGANSAGANVPPSSQVQVGSQAYLSYYHPTNWWGQLTASNLLYSVSPTNSAVGTLVISPTANWDASCVLTGGACTAMTSGSTLPTITVEAPSSRQILSWNGTSGIPFEFASLTSAQQTALPTATLSYLRGVRSGEVANSGSLRTRNSVLGDIIDSSPTWVGAPSSPYTLAGTDQLTGVTLPEFGASYASFAASNALRTNVVYVGANDGMLHGFRAGAYNAAGVWAPTTTSPNDGYEVIAYVPGAVVNSIAPSTATLNYSSPSYAHNDYVDATPGVGDVYYNGAWHSLLVGGLGAGGNTAGVLASTTSTAGIGVLYALDISNPARFSESNAASLVLGEWNSSNLTCTGVSNCKNNLGNVYGTPLIRRLHDGNWAAIFGNGLNSANGAAGIFIMEINSSSGALSFRYLDTGSASTTSPNGIVQVATADLDGDHVTDYVYAGDLKGNVWRFDLTSSNPADWALSSSLFKLFTAPQPITTRLMVTSVAATVGNPRVMLEFGTGQMLPQTLTSAASYATGSFALYGIWDWNMGSWNAKRSTQYASLAGPETITTSNLLTQTITTTSLASSSISGYRTVTQNGPICWYGSTTCSSGNTQFGWTTPLPGTNEQVVYNPVISNGDLLVDTVIPPASTAVLTCASPSSTGYTMALQPDTGGAPAVSPFQSAATSLGINAGTAVIAGLGLNATGTVSVITAGNQTFLLAQTNSGSGVTAQLNANVVTSNTLSGNRVSWRKIR